MKQHPLVLCAFILFLGGTIAASASTVAGTPADSLISKSYALGAYLNTVREKASNTAKKTLSEQSSMLQQVENNNTTQTIAQNLEKELLSAFVNGQQTATPPANSYFIGATGTEVIFTSGQATIHGGVWINLTRGKIQKSGEPIHLHEVYLSDTENASIKISQSASCSISGRYQVSSQLYIPSYGMYADALHTLGLFQGAINGYELERASTRVEGIVMLIRLLGKEDGLQSTTHPFTDVPSWANQYVAFAYENGYTSGISATKFGSSMQLRYLDYMTFLLRALGYDDKNGDFSWSSADQMAVKVGIQTEQERQTILQSGIFLRDHVAYTSYRTLFTELNRQTTRLCDMLVTENVFSQSQLRAVENLALP